MIDTITTRAALLPKVRKICLYFFVKELTDNFEEYAKEHNVKVIKYEDFFDITSKYKNKSDFIKQWYFEILDYQTIRLRKHSWIDTYKVYALNKNSTEIKFIGKLSDKDISRLKTFIKKIRMNKKTPPVKTTSGIFSKYLSINFTYLDWQWRCIYSIFLCKPRINLHFNFNLLTNFEMLIRF